MDGPTEANQEHQGHPVNLCLAAAESAFLSSTVVCAVSWVSYFVVFFPVLAIFLGHNSCLTLHVLGFRLSFKRELEFRRENLGGASCLCSFLLLKLQ